MTKKKLRFGALPTVNMPRRSHESKPPEPRPARSVVRDVEPESRSSCYKSFLEFCELTKSLKSIGDWCVKLSQDRVIFKKMVEPYLLPEVEIIVDDSLGFTVKVFGSYLVDDHPLYLKYRRTMCNVTLSNLVKDLENLKLCTGVNPMELTSKLFHHVVPVNHDCMREEEEQQQFPHKGFWRVKECLLFIQADGVCPACQDFSVCTEKARKAKESRSIKPAHVNAPVSKTDPERIKLTLQGQRLKCAQLEQQLTEMRAELLESSVEIDHELNHDFTQILDSAGTKVTPFMNLFY